MLRVFGWVLALATHGHDALEPTDRLAPPGWVGNPWGPAATEMRKAGSLPPIPMTPLMTQWDQWGKTVLRNGDIVFRRGDARLLMGFFPFSRWLARASGSQYSHTGIVSIEDGGPVVYDTTHSGVRRQPFCVWILDNVGPMGVKRLKPAYQNHVPAVLAACQKLFAQQPPFDFELDPDDSAFYCLEMTEKCFRAAGLTLSQPVRIGDFENIHRYPIIVVVFQNLTVWSLKHPLTLEQAVFLPGNERHGIWASPMLETIYPPTPVANSSPSGARH